MKMRRLVLSLLRIGSLLALSGLAHAQSPANLGDSVSAAESTIPLAQPDLMYARPVPVTKLRNYFFDAFGPYPIVGAALNAGIDEVDSTPPEWKQGVGAYGRRFVSDFGIAAFTTTTRYALAEAFHEDTVYYRCECKSTFPRLRHAMISTFTARRGDDGHRVVAVSALIAPYASTLTGVYGWYPGRYGAKDAFRMGNYSLLEGVIGNVALEFLYRGPRSLFFRRHQSDAYGARSPDSNP